MTTRTAKRQKPDPDALYVAWDSAWIGGAEADRGFVVKAGTKRRGDHRAVKDAPWLFLPADTPDDEVQRHRAHKYGEEEATARAQPVPPKDQVQVPEPLRDEDAVVATRDVFLASRSGLLAGPHGQSMTAPVGKKLPANHPLVKANRDAFVPVTDGVPRERAPSGVADGQHPGRGRQRPHDPRRHVGRPRRPARPSEPPRVQDTGGRLVMEEGRWVEQSDGIRRRRVMAGEGMVTPRERIAIEVDGKVETLIAGRSRITIDHPFVARHRRSSICAGTATAPSAHG